MSLNLVFPENTGRLPTSKLPLQFKHVLAVTYAFGGVSALIALISKFIITPLFEQLTIDRQLYAQEARYRLEALNAKLTTMVSSVPSVHNIRHGYVDVQVQTESAHNSSQSRTQYKPQDWFKFTRMTSFNDESQLTQDALTEVEDLEKYMRNIAFGFEEAGAPAKSSQIAEFRNEIRQFKGALIAL